MARTWAEIQKLGGGLSPAEKKLVEKCKAGEICWLGDERPEGPSMERTIRAEVLRYLILGGCDECRVHERGVQLVGAWVEGSLDLSFATARGPTSLMCCRFDSGIRCLQARLELLDLGGSSVANLNLQGAHVSGHVFLRHGFKAQGMMKRGGEVNLAGAVIDGQLACNGGQFEFAGGLALNAERMQVGESFFWRDVAVKAGCVDLTGAQVGDLVDNLASWPEAGRNKLDGFTYDRIDGKFTDVVERLKWLSRGTFWRGEFHPQPYTHLAKVYRSMGRDADARTVLIERNRLLAQHQRKALRVGPEEPTYKDVVVGWNWFKDFGLRNLVGYGYAPFRSVKWLLILWVAAVWLAAASWHEGSMVPNSDVILTSADWQAYDSRTHAGEEWAAATAPGQDWETFHPLAWGADLVIPILDLGQTQAWAPSTTRGRVGWHLWWAQWLLEAAGWIVAGLFAAAVTGIIRKDDD